MSRFTNEEKYEALIERDGWLRLSKQFGILKAVKEIRQVLRYFEKVEDYKKCARLHEALSIIKIESQGIEGLEDVKAYLRDIVPSEKVLKSFEID